MTQQKNLRFFLFCKTRSATKATTKAVDDGCIVYILNRQLDCCCSLDLLDNVISGFPVLFLVRTCRLPDIPSSMYIAKPTKYNRTYLTGEVITLACKKDFEEQVGGNPVRVCIYGRWTQFPFQCKGINCCLLKHLNKYLSNIKYIILKKNVGRRKQYSKGNFIL